MGNLTTVGCSEGVVRGDGAVAGGGESVSRDGDGGVAGGGGLGELLVEDGDGGFAVGVGSVSGLAADGATELGEDW